MWSNRIGSIFRMIFPAEDRAGRVVLAVLTVCFVALRWGALGADTTPIVFYDSHWYARVGANSVLSLDFWCNQRPWVYPGLIRLAGWKSFDPLPGVQALVAILAHIFLAVSVYHFVRPRLLAIVTVGLVYLYSLAFVNSGWDAAILTESVNFSLIAMSIAAVAAALGILPRDDVSWKLFSLVLGVCHVTLFLLAGIRDNWPLLLPFMAVLFAWPLASRRWRVGMSPREKWNRIAMVGVLLLVTVLSMQSAKIGKRHWWTLSNVVFLRILHDPGLTELWAERYGMPVSPELLDHRGLHFSFNNPGPEDFQNWVIEEGPRHYPRFLLSRPIQTTQEVRRAFRGTVDDFAMYYFNRPGAGSAAAHGASRIVFFPLRGVHEAALLFVMVASLGVAIGGPARTRPLALSVCALAWNFPFQVAINFLGDGNEPVRHLVTGTVILRLMLILSAALVASALIEVGARGRPTPRL